ncbi:MAG: sigma-70 family RNA polymerase sigma factor [Lewinellaceae bacterium]|nr:sigma-70 family RNA polymerase sigma factor [Lewinellaceae bacterium]
MHPLSHTQDGIIAALGSTADERRKWALRCLFEDKVLRQMSIAHVRKYGGNRQDGEDVFQEAIIVLDRKIRMGDFRGEGSIEGYFMGIVRWHWFNQQHKTGQSTRLAESRPEPPLSSNPELDYLLTERRELLEKLLQQLADKCRNLLKFYQLDFSMKEIAHQMGFANSGVAKKEAFLCRKRFRVLLERHPEITEK